MTKSCYLDAAAVSKQITKKHDVSDLYSAVQHHHQSDTAAAVKLHVNVQHDCLRPRLRDYQKTAVQWMLTKECYKLHSVADQSRG